MVMMKNCFLLILLLALAAASQAQPAADTLAQEAGPLHAITKKRGGEMLLRWAPADEYVWLNSLQGHYRIERYGFDKFEDFDPQAFTLLQDNIRPWPIARFEQAVASAANDRYLIMAAECVHGEWETLQSEVLDISQLAARREELQNRHAAALLLADMDAQAAEAMALRLTDRQMPNTEHLAYRITLVLDDSTTLRTTALYSRRYDIPFKPELKWYEALDGEVVLSWDRALHERHYHSYYIERSRDGRRYERLNEHPYIHAIDEAEAFGIPEISFTAEAENDVAYYYRIIGLDAFGDLSEPSQAVPLTARDLTPPIPPFGAEAEMQAGGYISIQWKQDESSEDMDGYIVQKSRLRHGEYRPISDQLPASARQFNDETADPFGNNYYRVCAVDRAGNEACTPPIYGFIRDDMPPAMPQGLEGRIDSAGVVHLHWDLGPERDLAGYHVYAANGPEQVFTRINPKPVRDTLYRDTIALNTLTEEIYYRIAAVDVRSNVSELSEMLRLEKPDTIPPTSALFEAYELRDSSVYLRWANSNSRDVLRHELHRRQAGGEWALLQAFTGYETEYEDRAVAPATDYEYEITAVDDAGLRSRVVRTLAVATRHRQAEQAPGLSAALEGERVRLQFQLPAPYGEIARVVVYKSVNEGEFRQFSTLLDGYALELADSECQSGNTYSYKYRIFYRNGLKSAYSAAQTVRR
jgi:uncharacterized protein